jgi:sugar phosphate isomerase/epimerase
VRIGIGSWAYLRYGLEEGARRAREHGFDCFDYSNFIHTDTDFFNLPEIEFEKELKRQRTLIETEGIRVNQAHAPWEMPVRCATPAERAIKLEKASKAVRGTAYIGATDFVIHAIMPFGENSPEHPELMRDLNAEFMGKLAEVAKEYGVKHINIENLPFPQLPINHTSQCLDFVKRMNKETNSDIFRVCLDTGHSNFCGESPADAVRTLGSYLGALHVHDNDGTADSHRIPGNGTIDWKDFSDALAQINYGGVLNFETAVSNDVPIGPERDRQERELALIGHKLAKNI